MSDSELIESPSYQIKHINIPLEVWNMAKAGKLGLREFFLFMEIHNYCNPHSGIPCYASDDHLARNMGITINNLQVRLHSLKRKGLVWTVFFSGRIRYLTTTYMHLQCKRYRTVQGDMIRKPKVPQHVIRILNQYEMARLPNLRQQGELNLRQQGELNLRQQGELNLRQQGELYTPTEYKRKNKLKGVSPNGRNAAESSPFFQDEKKKITKETKADKVAAKKLFTAIQIAGKISPRAKLSTWAKEIRKLREVDGISPAEINQVIDWYKDNLKGKYTPKAYLARTFRDKYHRIKDAMEREQGESKSHIKVTPAAKRILLELSPPPVFDRDRLVVAIQESLDAYRAFYHKVKGLAKALKGTSRETPITILLERLESGEHFVTQWFAYHCSQAENGYASTEENITFHLKHKHFRPILNKLIGDLSYPKLKDLL